MFSILEVDVTNDLKYAKVYVSIFSTNADRKQKTFNAICVSCTSQQFTPHLPNICHNRTCDSFGKLPEMKLFTV